MDRLSTLILGLIGLGLVGCESKSGEPTPGRANVSKGTSKAVTAEAFCDVHFAGDKGPVFQLPALVDGALPAKTTGWRWINVWATWCKPCVEEMPRLVSWQKKFGAAGKAFDLAFVSVDETAADLAAYRAERPELPTSPRLAEPAKQADWYTAVGLDGNAPIPIHIFVAPSGHVRCARAGGIREHDYAAVEKVLAQ